MTLPRAQQLPCLLATVIDMRHTLTLLVCLRSAGLLALFCTCVANDAAAQIATPHLVFTVSVPERAQPDVTLQVSGAVEERALAIWGGGASNFGVAVAQSRGRWTLRSISGITALPVQHQARPGFQQMELLRTVIATGRSFVAGGGGIREEWDGTRTLIGRVIAGSTVGSGRLEGSLVLEHAVASYRPHDSADVVTTIGWSRSIGERFGFGIESIGQDLEGLWDPAEADGGARLLVGPSLHARSRHSTWVASLTAGPVLHKTPAASLAGSSALSGGNHFGIFASANWVPSLRR